MKHIHTFESFVNEASAFDTKKLKNINFILQPFDAPYKDAFHFCFSNEVDKKTIEDALKAEPNAKVPYEWEANKYHENRIVFMPKKDNSALTYVFKALDDLYGQYGEEMGWVL